MIQHDAVTIRFWQLTGETGDASGIWDRSRGAGDYQGTVYQIKSISRIHRVPDTLIGPDSPEVIAVSHRVAVMHCLLEMG